MNLRLKLQVLGKEANHLFPYINHGGCCVYAAFLAEALVAAGFTAEVVAGEPTRSSNNTSLDAAREVLNRNNMHTGSLYNWLDAGVTFFHVGVHVKTNDDEYIVDSDKCHAAANGRLGKECKVLPGSLTIEEAKQLASQEEGWNPSFDRRDIPAVRNLIAKHFPAQLSQQAQLS